MDVFVTHSVTFCPKRRLYNFLCVTKNVSMLNMFTFDAFTVCLLVSLTVIMHRCNFTFWLRIREYRLLQEIV